MFFCAGIIMCCNKGLFCLFCECCGLKTDGFVFICSVLLCVAIGMRCNNGLFGLGFECCGLKKNGFVFIWSVF